MAKKNVIDAECNHEWEQKETTYNCDSLGYYSVFSQTATYKCKKCKEVKQEKRSETSRNEPMWWRH